MANLWFKFYGGEYLSDPKIERLSPLERSCWLTILCMASMTNGIIEFLTVESLLNRSGIQFNPYHPEEWEKALSVLVKFEKMRMIEATEDGQIIVKNWEKRQEHNLTVAERVAKHRKNKVNVTGDVTSVTTEENRVEENRVYNNLDRQKAIGDGFDIFWEAYPRGIGKGAARKAWSKIKSVNALLPKILASVEAHKATEQWQKGNGQYIPHPATFINQERWDDEVTPQQKLEPIIL